MKKVIGILVSAILLFSSSIVLIATPQEDILTQHESFDFKTYNILDMEDTSSLNVQGAETDFIQANHYVVPTHIETYTFPIGTTFHTIQCTPSKIQSHLLQKPLSVVPPPVLSNGQLAQIDSMDSYEPLTVDSWYSYDIGTGLVDGELQHIVKIQLFPIQYTPSSNMIDMAEHIDIDIKYTLPEQQMISQESAQLLIITVDDYTTALEPLISHKESRNISTTLVTLSEILDETYFPNEGRDTIENIKYFIKNAVEQWGTSFLLLVGGFSDIPSREAHVSPSPDDYEVFVSDLYYADIYNETFSFASWDTNENDIFAEYDWDDETDEMDCYPDVYYGRLACIDTTQVEICVNKIIQYETTEAYSQDWFSKLVVIGGDTVPSKYGDTSGIDEGEYMNQKVIDYLDGFIPDAIWDSNNRLGGLNPTGVSAINTAINEGCGFVEFSGHGAPWVWTTYPHNGTKQSLPTPTGSYRNSDISDLSNGDKLPIAINGGCSLGKFNENENCFGWAYLANPNGGGIASTGCTGLGYIYIGKYVTQGLVEGLALNMIKAYVRGANTFGEMWGEAVSIYHSTRLQGGDYKTLLEWEVFGDPTLAIATESQAPDKPDLEGSTSGKIKEEYTYTAVTNDPDGDTLSYLFDWGDGTYSGWIGPRSSGTSIEATHTWMKKGTYEIRVIAKDSHGVKSQYSDPLPISMPHNRMLNMFSDGPFATFLHFLSSFTNGLFSCTD